MKHYSLLILIACSTLALQAAQEGDDAQPFKERDASAINVYVRSLDSVRIQEGMLGCLTSFDLNSLPESERKNAFIEQAFLHLKLEEEYVFLQQHDKEEVLVDLKKQLDWNRKPLAGMASCLILCAQDNPNNLLMAASQRCDDVQKADSAPAVSATLALQAAQESDDTSPIKERDVSSINAYVRSLEPVRVQGGMPGCLTSFDLNSLPASERKNELVNAISGAIGHEEEYAYYYQQNLDCEQKQTLIKLRKQLDWNKEPLMMMACCLISIAAEKAGSVPAVQATNKEST